MATSHVTRFGFTSPGVSRTKSLRDLPDIRLLQLPVVRLIDISSIDGISKSTKNLPDGSVSHPTLFFEIKGQTVKVSMDMTDVGILVRWKMSENNSKLSASCGAKDAGRHVDRKRVDGDSVAAVSVDPMIVISDSDTESSCSAASISVNINRAVKKQSATSVSGRSPVVSHAIDRRLVAMQKQIGICGTCNLAFFGKRCRELLAEHVTSRHGSGQVCPLCRKSFSTAKRLELHVRNGHSHEVIESRGVLQQATSLSPRTADVQQDKSNAASRSCKHCEKKFVGPRWSNRLSEHERTCQPNVLNASSKSCNKCGKKFLGPRWEIRMRAHECICETVVSESSTATKSCNKCGKKFLGPRWEMRLYAHERICETAVSESSTATKSCNKCGKKFLGPRWEMRLHAHKRICETAVSESTSAAKSCNKCGKKFLGPRWEMRLHAHECICQTVVLESNMATKSCNKCDVCCKTFKSRWRFDKHMRWRHCVKTVCPPKLTSDGGISTSLNSREPLVDILPSNSTHQKPVAAGGRLSSSNTGSHVAAGKYTCKMCSKSFWVKLQLDRHVMSAHRKSLSERRSETDTGAQRSGMSVASRKNGGGKARLKKSVGNRKLYRCQVCEKVFLGRMLLVRHLEKEHCNVVDEKSNDLSPDAAPTKDVEAVKKWSVVFRKDKQPRHVTRRKSIVHRCTKCTRVFSGSLAGAHMDKHMKSHMHSSVDTKCPICSKVFTFRRNLSVHIKIKHGKNSDEAVIKTDSISTNLWPVVTKSDESDGLKNAGCNTSKMTAASCTQCPHVYTGYRAAWFLKKHVVTHSNPNRHKCPICGIIFGTKISVTNHTIQKHGLTLRQISSGCTSPSEMRAAVRNEDVSLCKPVVQSCTKCSRVYTGKNAIFNLKRHMVLHLNPNSVRCRICDALFARYSALWSHVKRAHGKNLGDLNSSLGTEAACKTCPRVFTGSHAASKLRRHLMYHSNPKSPICAVCGVVYPSKVSLAYHLKKTHGDTMRKDMQRRPQLRLTNASGKGGVKVTKKLGSVRESCDKCPLVCTGRHAGKFMRKHMTYHSLPDPVPCPVCGIVCGNKANLQYHVKKRHYKIAGERATGIRSPVASLSSTSVDKSNDVMTVAQCDKCMTKFYGPYAYTMLQRHALTHLESEDVKPLICDMCKEAFVTEHDLSLHSKCAHDLASESSEGSVRMTDVEIPPEREKVGPVKRKPGRPPSLKTVLGVGENKQPATAELVSGSDDVMERLYNERTRRPSSTRGCEETVDSVSNSDFSSVHTATASETSMHTFASENESIRSSAGQIDSTTKTCTSLRSRYDNDCISNCSDTSVSSSASSCSVQIDDHPSKDALSNGVVDHKITSEAGQPAVDVEDDVMTCYSSGNKRMSNYSSREEPLSCSYERTISCVAKGISSPGVGAIEATQHLAVSRIMENLEQSGAVALSGDMSNEEFGVTQPSNITVGHSSHTPTICSNPIGYDVNNEVADMAVIKIESEDDQDVDILSSGGEDEETVATQGSRSSTQDSGMPSEEPVGALDSSHTCKICGGAFPSFDLLVLHKNDFHKFRCKLCTDQFTTRELLREHKLSHGGSKHVCAVCNQWFLNVNFLMAHMRIHEGERKHECKRCGKKFLEKGQLLTHARTHWVVPHYPCEICGHRFREKGQLETHVQLYQGRPHVFRQVFKKHVCTACRRRFHKESELIEHWNSFTVIDVNGSRIDLTSPAKNKSTDRAMLRCGTCHREFTTQRLVYEHLVHTPCGSQEVPSLSPASL